jgi:hypothetical protein
MNKLITFLSTIFIVAAAFSPLQLRAGSTSPYGSQQSFPSERIFAIYAINSGDTLNAFLDNLTTSEENGNKKLKYTIRFEFGDGTTITTTIAFFSNGNVEPDSNFDYFKSVLVSKPELLTAFEDIANDSPFLINININSGTSDFNSLYINGFSDFCYYCMANIVDSTISFFKNNPNVMQLAKGVCQYMLTGEFSVEFKWTF